MVFVISYDLNRPGQDYTDLFEAIKGCGSWCHALKSTWYVDSQMDATSIRDTLVRVADKNDQILVTRASAPGAWTGLSDAITKWLKEHL